MAITINGVTYRNLQQQVLWLTKKVEELIDAGGGYTAGYGIDITEGTIAADLTEVQQKLVAGPNITINGNVISATNGGGGGSSKEVTDIDFPFGDATVSYDTTDGMTITGTAKLTFDDGSTVNANCDVEVPFVPGAGITMDADSTGKKVVIKAIAADYVSLTLPSGATSGTITSAQLATLQSNDTAYIIINGKELYYLADKNTVNGILTYTHNGYNEAGVQKYFNLTVSTRAFTINQEESIIQYVDISSATGTINANDMILISDPTGLNCVRYNGYVLRFVRKVSNNYGVYYYSCLAGVTSYWLSITKDSTGAGIYVVNTYDLSEGGGSSKEYQAGTGITFSDYNNITTISADIVQNSGLKFTGPLQGEKLTIDDTVIQKKLTAGDNITISEDNVISATGGSSLPEAPTTGVYNLRCIKGVVQWSLVDSYQVTTSLNNLTLSNPGPAVKGENFVTTLIPAVGYKAPGKSNVVVKINNASYTSFSYVEDNTYGTATLTIPASALTGVVYIAATAVTRYKYTVTVSTQNAKDDWYVRVQRYVQNVLTTVQFPVGNNAAYYGENLEWYAEAIDGYQSAKGQTTITGNMMVSSDVNVSLGFPVST